MLFTENESNTQRLWGVPNRTRYVKDGINDAVVNGVKGTVNPEGSGTKVAAHYTLSSPLVRLRRSYCVCPTTQHERPFEDTEKIFETRQAEADSFYMACGAKDLPRGCCAQCSGRLLLDCCGASSSTTTMWTCGCTAIPHGHHRRDRHSGPQHDWRHLYNADIISMPDTWEYPWFAAWDLAFHCVPLALVDPDFAKKQLILLLREWYMHPNGQIPAYEWAFGDVNPPVHAWAALACLQDRASDARARRDRAFLERVFHKLLLNFTWWVNRKDSEGRNVFQGGFLGLDNIGVFDRSAPLPTGGHLEQSDGTAWMGMYCLNMLAIALELARENRAYEDVATKFFEHFLYIADALNNIGGEGISLWDEEDQFFYDVLHLPDGSHVPLKVRSLVGFIPLLAVETIEPDLLDALPEFKARLEWFLEHRPHLASLVSRWHEPGMEERRLLALVRGHRMKRLLKRMLDSEEFLSDYGIRAISKYHAEHPYDYRAHGMDYVVRYEPA